MATIYKICTAARWHAAEAAGIFHGSPVDLADGFIHFSTAAQVADTAARHYAGQDGLLIIAIDGDRVPVKYEPSRGGGLFPHLYGSLDLATVLWAKPLPLGPDGRHVLPPLQE